MRLVKAVILLSLVSCYHGLGGDGKAVLGHQDVLLSIENEQEGFVRSGVCSRQNQSKIDVCGDDAVLEVRTFNDSKFSNCRCDDLCFVYGDCCIDKVLSKNSRVPWNVLNDSQGWNCVEVRDSNGSFNRIYANQKCSTDWEDGFIRDMCEIEAIERQRNGMAYDHLQHIPVMSEDSRIIYRNVYCAICNRDTQIYRMESEIICFGINTSYSSQSEDLDFANAVYEPRTMMYRKVKVGDKLRNCYLKIQEFKLDSLITEFGARMCKHVIDVCSLETSSEIQQKCKAYSSYVYRNSGFLKERIDTQVYKNFHCALCNGIPTEDLVCRDPYKGRLFTHDMQASMSLLFDFNFGGGLETVGGLQSCLMKNHQMWDPMFKKCRNITCGSKYERNKFQCIPLNESVTGMNNNCIKIILDIDEFTLLPNGSAYINKTMRILSLEEFEAHKKVNGKVINIAVCLDSNPNLLPYSKAYSLLSVITLSISITCLILHLVVYSLLEKLRNCPGKVLMSLSASLLIGHIFLLLGPHFVSTFWICYFNGVATHFGYLSAFSWMSVMAYDIYGTFSVTQSQNTRKQKAFVRYSLYAWTSSLTMVIISVVIDASLSRSSKFRPKYGDPICWFNNKKGLLVFFVVPATILLLANISLFAATAFHIHKVSKQTKMVNNFSDKVRYYLYLKLAVVLGLTWILGLIAGITQIDAFWYAFIVLNGLQGALIFMSFTIKRNIMQMLAVRLKLRSDKYRMSKPIGIKAAMYSSLSNLTLQTTTSSQIPSLSEKKDMLKSVRKINPDAIIEHHSNR